MAFSDWLKEATAAVSQRGGFFVFLRAQLSGQMASICDFLLTILLVRMCGMYYLYATLLGTICGGIVNGIINYKWTFKDRGSKWRTAFRFLIVWLCSIWLNTWGTYTLTELMLHLPWLGEWLSRYVTDFFLIPKLVVAILVAIFWNYYMHSHFVYRCHHDKLGNKNSKNPA